MAFDWMRGLSLPSAPAPSKGGGKAFDIYRGLVNRGLPSHVAEGIVMNLEDESGLNPGINEIAPIVPGSRGGYGLAQWTGPRRKQLEAFAADRGAPVSDTDTQLDFLMYELQGPERAAFDRLMAAGSTGDAAASFATNFLRPAKSHLDRRVAKYTGADLPFSEMPTGGYGTAGFGGYETAAGFGGDDGDPNALKALIEQSQRPQTYQLDIEDFQVPYRYV